MFWYGQFRQGYTDSTKDDYKLIVPGTKTSLSFWKAFCPSSLNSFQVNTYTLEEMNVLKLDGNLVINVKREYQRMDWQILKSCNLGL